MGEENNGKPAFAADRRERILELLETTRRVAVQQLSEMFGVSDVTTRNDLRDLEAVGLLRRVHGGAVPVSRTRFELPTKAKEDKYRAEKERIGAKAAEMIGDGDTVILDSGTTTLEVAKRLKDKQDLTVVVNDLTLALALETFPGVNLIMIGGSMRRAFSAFVGPIAIKALGEICVDKAFIATNGVTVKRGITTPDLIHAETKKAMIKAAQEVIVVADSSKIGANSFATTTPLASVDKLITDDKISAEDIKLLENEGVEVIVA